VGLLRSRNVYEEGRVSSQSFVMQQWRGPETCLRTRGIESLRERHTHKSHTIYDRTEREKRRVPSYIFRQEVIEAVRIAWQAVAV